MIKFLQIHLFYEAYLKEFYAARPGLSEASCDQQIAALLDDEFATSHMFAPHLREFGYDTRLIIANAAPAQFAWARQHGKTALCDQAWFQKIVHAQVEEFRPDILYLSHPIELDSKFVRSLSFKPKLVMGWRAAAILAETDFSEFDLILSHDSFAKQVALKHGAKRVEHFLPGFPARIASKLEHEPKEVDVTFSGQWSPDHTIRNQFLFEVAKAPLGWHGEFSVAFYLACGNPEIIPAAVAMYNRGARWGIEMNRVLRRGRIVINATTDVQSGEAGNMRTFETTGSGSFMLTQDSPTVAQYFEPGKEVETFRSAAELIEKVYFYLAHPDKREAIAAAGQIRCLRDHSMGVRTAWLHQIISKALSSSETKIVTANVELPKLEIEAVAGEQQKKIEGLLAHSKQLFEEFKFEDALQVTIEAKKARVPVRDLDYLRALIFLRLNRTGDAVEALKEELRYFPHNQEARNLLERTSDPRDSHVVLEQLDPQFRSILPVLKKYTMIPLARLYNLYQLARLACQHDIPGNFVECGVAAGGSSAMLAWVIKNYSKRPRMLFSFDSFSGMPKPTKFDTHAGVSADDSGWGTGTCSSPESSLIDACSELGVREYANPIKGFFENTLALYREQVGQIALLHLDADWYSSTVCILENFYDQVVPGGLMQFDDYGHWEGCRKATEEFQRSRNISLDLKTIDGAGVCCQKSLSSSAQLSA